MDLSTTYLGLKLKNPLIAGSSGLTNRLDDLKNIEKHGAAAVILKSIFEEEIVMELEQTFNKMTAQGFIYPETMSYFDYDEIEDTLSNYIKLISDAKKNLKIPVIGSVNCVTAQKWTSFAKDIEDAGADAIELNAFILPSDFSRKTEDFEQVYFDIVKEVKKQVSIPIALKVSYFFSNLGPFLKRLSGSGIDGLVLFNRFYNPDIDIDKMHFTASNVLSNPEELSTSLRWIGILAERSKCDLSASTGVHDGAAIVKQLLAGAKTVQTASALYKHGIGHLSLMLHQLEEWMEAHDYKSVDEFRAKMAQSQSDNPAAYERVQFMKYFRDRD